MNRVGEFEKVSFEQFYAAMKDEFYLDAKLSVNGVGMFPVLTNNNGDIVFEESIRELYDSIQLPARATGGSAGYDFKAPFAFTLAPGQTIKIPTGIRVQIDDGWWLGCLPRSGLGFKYQIRLANTLGVVDSDYYDSSNEGHIFLKIVNGGDNAVEVSAGDGIAQCVFIPYGITYSDNAIEKRNGGFGSTGR